MSVPYKYRKLGDFHQYYSGEKQAPVLTLVIGGNHEASNYFYELYHGGWIAPNIYYLGAANVIRYGPCRIAGLSGIFSGSDYRKPHSERLPYSRDDIRAIYHVREYDVRKLLQIQTQVDIGISHDWPAWVELFGDHQRLFAMKPHFLESAKIDNLGSKSAALLINHFRPAYWFSGHMHTRFSAKVEHKGELLEDSIRSLTISEDLKAELPIFKPQPRPTPNTKRIPSKPAEVNNIVTEFLALDKVGPNREFLELMEIRLCSTSSTGHDESSYFRKTDKGKFTLQYDAEWLAITRAFADGLQIKNASSRNINPGKPEKSCVSSIPTHMSWVKENIVDKDLLKVPENFAVHAPVHDPLQETMPHQQPPEYPNSQTEQFYSLLQIPNQFSPPPKKDLMAVSLKTPLDEFLTGRLKNLDVD
jgi:lariat debranching enzyme